VSCNPVDEVMHAWRSLISTYTPNSTSVLLRSIEPGQYLCVRYSERLDENDIVASVGSRGDSYDNAMAESFNSLYKWELIYPQGPWRGLDDVEFATLGYIDWFNHRRLHGEVTDDTPTSPRQSSRRPTTVRQHPPSRRPTNRPSSHEIRGGSDTRAGRH